MAHDSQNWQLDARARALQNAIFGRRGPFCNKNWPNIAFTSEKSEETTTKALGLYFNVGYLVFEKHLSWKRYVPITTRWFGPQKPRNSAPNLQSTFFLKSAAQPSHQSENQIWSHFWILRPRVRLFSWFWKVLGVRVSRAHARANRRSVCICRVGAYVECVHM